MNTITSSPKPHSSRASALAKHSQAAGKTSPATASASLATSKPACNWHGPIPDFIKHGLFGPNNDNSEENQ